MKVCFRAMLRFLVASSLLAQLPYTEQQAITYAKSIDVHALDSSLPSQRLEDWLQNGAPHVHIGSWIVADTCDLKEPEFEFPKGDWPVCVRVSIYRDGEEGYRYGQGGYLLVQVGNAKKGIAGRPQLNQPFGVWDGSNVMTGGSERLSDLPAILDQPVVTGDVFNLYQEIVAHHPIGIPAGAEMVAIRPYLSKRLAEQFQTVQACQDDFGRQHSAASGVSKPGWLKTSLFSGEGSHASPVDAMVDRRAKQNDGSFLVYVDLEPADAVINLGHGRRAFHGGYTWQVEARVVSENGRFVVDDVRIFDRFPAEGASQLLSESFAGCDGSHWTGPTAAIR